jgi:hypothetical protein
MRKPYHMKLLPNEHLLTSSNGDKIILTDHRIHLTDRVWGKSYQITIFLEDISSFENTYKSNIIWLILAVLSVTVGLINMASQRSSELMIGGLVLAALSLIWWASSRRHLVAITSSSGTALSFEVEGMGEAQVEDFVYKVQGAKLERVNQLNR